MAKIHKTAQVAQGISTGSKVCSFWVFSAFEGKGVAKMPLCGYSDELLAKQHADEVQGYYVNMSVKNVK